MNYWVTVYRFAWIALIILLAIGAVCIFIPRCGRMNQLQKEKTERLTQNREIEDGVHTLRDKQERFSSDPAFVERVAREAGMVKPDETVFKLTNDSRTAVAPAAP